MTKPGGAGDRASIRSHASIKTPFLALGTRRVRRGGAVIYRKVGVITVPGGGHARVVIRPQSIIGR